IYNYTETAALPQIFDEAAAQGMAVLGHFPVGQAPEQTLDAGMAALAHGQAFLWFWGENSRLINSASAALARNDSEIVATLAHWAILASVWGGNPSGLAAYYARPELRYLHPTSRDLNERSIHGPRFNPPGAVPGELQSRLEFVAAYLRRFHAEGVPLLLGSDSPTVLGVPGFSAIEELEVMGEQLQLDNIELLRIGTHNGGRFVHARVAGSERFGHLAVGQRADLIALSADPRDDLAHLHQRIGVMAQGRWYRADGLQAQIDALALRYAGQSFASEALPQSLDHGHGSGAGH
ncbi:MAG: hypothetical protein KDI51_18660, partial [Xanthomonadales bacterium]|nr:hypothetical protein [Xanthomonadales bacterium]